MKALRWHALGDVRVDQIATPKPPAPHEIGIQVAACGICGSDVHEYRAGPFVIPTEPHPGTGQQAPLVLGHEIAGWVTNTGEGVTNVSTGDLVALNALIPCHDCPQCLVGRFQLCANLGHLGQTCDGGLCQQLTVPAEMAVRANPTMAPEVLALAEPFAVAMHAINKIPDVDGTALITGAGTIGLAIALLLEDRGMHVVIVDPQRHRRDHAARLGLNAVADLPAATVHQAGTAFECSGAASAFNMLFTTVRPGGDIVLVGFPDDPPTLDIATAIHRELTLHTSVGHTAMSDMTPAVRYLEDHATRAQALITDRIGIDEVVTDGFEALMAEDASTHGKIMVTINRHPADP
jgi:(R,R)-butanediol dehydrogenase/meso-butanediol dehydrogenase/diacetyl reductase